MRVSENGRRYLVGCWLSADELQHLDSLVRAERSNRSEILRSLLGQRQPTCDDAPRHYLTATTESAMRLDWQRGRHTTYSLAERWNVSQSSAATRVRQWRQREGSNA